MNARSTLGLLMAATVAVGVSGCGDKAQTADAGVKKADAKAWEGGGVAAYSAGGWKSGDKGSWEAQMKARAQHGQNEYSRAAAASAETKSQ
jgi:hypothetical protein